MSMQDMPKTRRRYVLDNLFVERRIILIIVTDERREMKPVKMGTTATHTLIFWGGPYKLDSSTEISLSDIVSKRLCVQ
jgi:hypothetical protein